MTLASKSKLTMKMADTFVGETGSGKTSAAKHLLWHLANMTAVGLLDCIHLWDILHETVILSS
jgi:ABC-type microcin C transport system duplicated ATPase subunit YejF